MFDDFEGVLNGEPHRIPSTHLYGTVARAALNTVYVVREDAYVIDVDGSLHVDPDASIFGDDERSEDLEDFPGDASDAVLLVRTEGGYVVDASELLDDVPELHLPTRMTDEERARFGKVIAFVETRAAAQHLYRIMADRLGIEFDDQANALLADLSSMSTRED